MSVRARNGIGILTGFKIDGQIWSVSYSGGSLNGTSSGASFNGYFNKNIKYVNTATGTTEGISTTTTTQPVILGKEIDNCQVTLFRDNHTPTPASSTSVLSQITLLPNTHERIGFKQISLEDCESKGILRFKEKELTTHYNNLSANDKILEKGYWENLIYKLRHTGCIVFEGEGTGNYAVVPDGNTNIQVISLPTNPLDSTDKAQLAKNYGKARGKGNRLGTAIEVAQQLTAWYETTTGTTLPPNPAANPNPCRFCPDEKIIPPAGCAAMENLYIRAGSTLNAENALKKLCAQSSFFGRNTNPGGVINKSEFCVITDLLALTNSEIVAFFNDVLCNNNIANAPDNTRSMCNFVAQMSLDIVGAWKICKDARPTTSSIRLDWDILQSVERYLRDANLRTKLFINNQDRFLKMLPSSANYVGECNTCAPSTSTACERLPYFHTYLNTLLDFADKYGTKTGFSKFITSEATASEI